MIDNFGFIVNKEIETGRPIDMGDSCFFMGLRALIASIKKEYNIVKGLFEKCKSIDFYRHPIFYEKDTSYDMILIWDFIYYRFPEVKIELPSFHYRKSKFFTGKHRNKLFYYKIIAIIISNLFKLIKKILQFDNYYKLHLLMLYLGAVYYKYKKHCKLILKEMRNWTLWIEKITGYPNYFFRWLCDLDYNLEYFWKDNANEWNYQRDPRTNNVSRKDVEFHQENGIDLSKMFYFAISKQNE